MTPPKRFVTIPENLLKTSVPMPLLVLYAKLKEHAAEGCVKHAVLAAELGVSRRQILYLLNDLRDRGVVEWTRHKQGNEYRFPGEVFHSGDGNVNCRTSHLDSRNVNTRTSHFAAYDSGVLENTNGGRGNGGSGGKGRSAAVSSPTTKKPPTRDEGPRRILRQAAAGSSAGPGTRSDPEMVYPSGEDRGPRTERPRPQKPRTDFWPHSEENVARIRSLLWDLGNEVGLGAPDDEILRRVLDCGKGADHAALVRTIQYLFERKKFANVRSWGLVPTIVEQFFAPRPKLRHQ